MLGHAPLSNPPVELRLTFTVRNIQYIFVDTANGNVLRRTGIPVHKDELGNLSLEEEDIETFIFTQLKSKDIKISSFELMGGY